MTTIRLSMLPKSLRKSTKVSIVGFFVGRASMISVFKSILKIRMVVKIVRRPKINKIPLWNLKTSRLIFSKMYDIRDLGYRAFSETKLRKNRLTNILTLRLF